MNEPDETEAGQEAGDTGDAADDGGDDQNGAHGAGAMPPPQRGRGGRPKGSRNKATIAREQGVAAPPPETSRPAGKTGTFPDEVEGRIPSDADQLWMYVLEEIQAKGWSPYDMEIRVDRKLPLPAGPVTEFDASAVMGDASTSPATALRKFVRDWIHLPSGVNGPGLYVLHFCWKNKAHFFRRGEIKMPSRNECVAMIQSEEARQSQTGAAGLPAPHFPQPQQQRAPQPPPPQPYYGFGAQPQPVAPQAPAPQAPSPRFDPEAERAKIRAELEREQEMRDLRRELDELRRGQRFPPQYGPGYGNGYPPPQTRRGVGAPPSPSPYDEDPDARTARVVVSVLQQMGIGPNPRPTTPGVGSPVIEGAQQQMSGAVDDLERTMETLSRGKKLVKKMKEIFDEGGDEEEEKPKKQGVGAAPEEEVQPKIRFQKTGQTWRDGREVMMPIDEAGDPILPTTIQAALATGFANPFLLEPIAQGVGELIKTGSSLMQRAGAGLGKPPPIHDPSIHVQQQQQPSAAPPPMPYQPQQHLPPQQPAPQQSAPAPAPASSDDGWNLT